VWFSGRISSSVIREAIDRLLLATSRPWRGLRICRPRRRNLDQLRMLDDRLLADIGVSRNEVEDIVNDRRCSMKDPNP